nr:hypothetical protein [Betaproteobacteria bacterium AqS2]
MTEGGQATYQVRLKTQPSVNVTVAINTGDLRLRYDTDPDTAGRQDTLTFNRTDQTNLWSDYQTVTLFAEHDDDMDDKVFRANHSSADGDYSWEGNPPVFGVVTVTVTDDDKPTPSGTIQISPAGTLTIDEGDSTGGTFQVSLSTAP